MAVGTDRCRLCTANDEAALIEEVAEALWISRDGRTWAGAGPSWQRTFRELATTAVHAMRHGLPAPVDDSAHRIMAAAVRDAAEFAVLKAQRGRR